MINEKEIIVTNEGLAEFKREYEELINVKIPENLEKIKAAREMGDLSENADYSAARDEQAKLEQRRKELEEIIDNAKVLNVNDSDRASMGKNVTFYNNLAKKEQTVLLVPTSAEVDVLSDNNRFKISIQTPIGKALNGHKVGEEVKVETDHPFTIKILKIWVD